MSSSSDRGATPSIPAPWSPGSTAVSDRNRHPEGTVNLRWRVRCMVVLVCLSQLLEELRHFRLQDNQV